MSAVSTSYVRARQRVLADHIAREQAITRFVVESCPEKKLSYKPHRRSMGFAQLAQHLMLAGDFFFGVIEKGKTPAMGEGVEPAPPKSRRALMKLFDSLAETNVKRFRRLSAKKLTKTIDFFGVYRPTGIELAEWHVTHLIHHRGQLSVYLRTMGATVPSIYGPSSDVDFEGMMKQDRELERRLGGSRKRKGAAKRATSRADRRRASTGR